MLFSIVATVVSVIALILTLRREWLDRPRLVVTVDPMGDPNTGSFELVATVDNYGRQPMTVKQIGLACRVEPGALPTGEEATVTLTDPWYRQRVEAFGHTQIRWKVPDELDVHADTPFRPFAEYGDHKRVWGRPLRHYRWLLEMGWNPSERPEALTDRRDGIAAKAVEPRWKFWKPSYLRRDTTTPRPLAHEEIMARVRRIEEERQALRRPPST